MAKNLTLHYAAGQGAYWMSYCAAIGYASVFLTGRGFSAGNIGLLMAGVNAAGALIQPAVAAAADRSATHTLNFYLRICQIISLAAAIGLCIGPHTLTAAALCSVPLCVGIMTQQPLMNALATYFMDRGQTVDDGKARGTGSISYAAISYVLGRVTAHFGSDAMPFAVLLILALLAALLSGDEQTFCRFRCDAPELRSLPQATFEWYSTYYLDRYYPVRFLMKFNGVKFPEA